jgi:DNA-directed RNA polymerase subunit RPC12/RpoP
MSYRCSPCGETFSSLDLFDRHQSVNYSRTPAVRCKSVASLRRRGLVQAPTGTWTTPEGALRIAQASEMGKSRKKGGTMRRVQAKPSVISCDFCKRSVQVDDKAPGYVMERIETAKEKLLEQCYARKCPCSPRYTGGFELV